MTSALDEVTATADEPIHERPATRHALAVAALIALGTAAYAVAGVRGGTGGGFRIYWIGLLGGAAVLAAAWPLVRRMPRRWVTVTVLMGAAAFRLVLLPTMPVVSDDLYRYVWDGRVQAEGINPYRFPPSAPELAELRDDVVWPEINRKDARTIYPGGAQLVYAAAWRVGIRSPVALKVAFATIEFGAVLLLLRLLDRRRRPRHLALLYAWNPLPVIAFGHSGHLEALVVPALLLAALAWEDDAPVRTGAWLGVAAALKLYPIALLPAFLRRASGRWAPSVVLVTTGVLALTYLPYLGVGDDVFGYLTTGYLEEEGYVSGQRFLLARALGLPGEALVVAVAVVLGAWTLRSRAPAAVKAGWILAAGLTLTTPYPWYAAPMLALVVGGGTGLPRAPEPAEALWPAFAVGLYLAYVKWLAPGVERTTIRQVLAFGVVGILGALLVRARFTAPATEA